MTRNFLLIINALLLSLLLIPFIAHAEQDTTPCTTENIDAFEATSVPDVILLCTEEGWTHTEVPFIENYDFSGLQPITPAAFEELKATLIDEDKCFDYNLSTGKTPEEAKSICEE